MRQAPDNVLKAVEKMPAFPKSVQQVLQLTADINCLPKDLVNVIKNDPVFTLKILKVVNSPFMGLANKITSIHQGQRLPGSQYAEKSFPESGLYRDPAARQQGGL